MPEASGIPDFSSRVIEHARKDFPLLDADMTVGQALDRIRREGVGERVIYFFAVDSDKRPMPTQPVQIWQLYQKWQHALSPRSFLAQ